MKVLGTAILTCLLAAAVSAQEASSSSSSSATSTDAPSVAVMQKNWRREVRHPALDEDPFRAGREATQVQMNKRETIRGNVINKQLGRDTVPLPTAQPALVTSRGPSPIYVYEVKFMNTGTKTIRALVWEYVFFDPDTRQDVGRHLYRTEMSLRPGKNKKLVELSLAPPTSIVNVTKTGAKLQQQYPDRVVINRIEYSDGTHWQRPSN